MLYFKPHSLQSLWMESWENQRCWWGLSFPESVSSAQLIEENQFLCRPFLSKSKPTGFYSLSPRERCCLLDCLILGPENSARQPSGWWCPNTARQMWVELHFGAGSYWLLSALRKVVPIIFPSVIFGSCPGSWECSVLCTLFGDAVSKGLINIARNIYSLSWLNPDKIVERIFLR